MPHHNNTALISLRGITFGYHNLTRLFEGLDLSVAAGMRIGIIGPNGCGKTTLFNIIMGFARPACGVIEVFEKERKNEKDFHAVREKIGYLFQNSDDQLFCPSVKEEVAFGLLNYRVPKPEIEKRIKDALGIVGMQGFEDRAPYRLSEGEKKRLAIATLVALKPEVLLLDEPTNGIDEQGIEAIERILQDKKTYIIISQDRDFLKRNTDSLCTIRDGGVVNIG
jgi:cobalt/nickel transport system ATP-binding protein